MTNVSYFSTTEGAAYEEAAAFILQTDIAAAMRLQFTSHILACLFLSFKTYYFAFK